MDELSQRFNFANRIVSRQKKDSCEDTKSSSLAGEKRGGASAFHAPLNTITGPFFSLLPNNRSRGGLTKIDSRRGLILQ